jgi:hypothetical protein
MNLVVIGLQLVEHINYLSDSRQRALYGADPRAKLRDSIGPDVLRRNENDMGQYGGGILRNNNTPAPLRLFLPKHQA